MNIDHQRKIVAILRILDQSGQPMGSISLSRGLAEMGIDLRERMVRNYLQMTDRDGLTENLGRRGRVITDKGRKEMEVAVAIDKVGFVNSRIDELTYQMQFDENSMSGTVIMNISMIKTSQNKQVLDNVVRILNARLGMGRFFLIGYAGQAMSNLSDKIPPHHIVVGTICSVTINGILLRHSISMTSRFGGLLELSDGVPIRFSQIINYDASTIDPLEIFIKSKMTSVIQAVRTGTGSIGGSFREIPAAALPAAKVLIEKLDRLGLGGVLMIGKPNQPLLDIPVGVGRVGLIVAAGLNPIAALEEIGLTTINRALFNLCDFDRLQPIKSFREQS